MTWLTWRQQRTEVLWSVVLLVVLGMLLFLSGREMFATYQQTQQGTSVAACVLHHAQDPICDALTGSFRDQFGNFSVLLLTLTILPALSGMFPGAPLVAREMERGTYQLAWTQSISRLRWIAVKIGVLVLVTALLFTASSLLLMWWRGSLDQVGGDRFSYGFDLEGVAPVAYALFALALGIAAGAILRRTLAAMAVTLGGFVALRGVVEFGIRPRRYLAPVAQVTDPTQGNPHPYNGDWVLNAGFSYLDYLDRQGHVISSADAVSQCAGSAKGAATDFSTCLHDHGVHLLNLYQPAQRFWLFQGIESAIFLALALILLGLAVWWVTRRIT